jgi:hypothetical protein
MGAVLLQLACVYCTDWIQQNLSAAFVHWQQNKQAVAQSEAHTMEHMPVREIFGRHGTAVAAAHPLQLDKTARRCYAAAW